jgi:hypothetical protein
MTRTPSLTWRKSSYSVDGPQCVELADTGATVLVRDSKHPDHGHLTLNPTTITALVAAAKTGQLDHLI